MADLRQDQDVVDILDSLARRALEIRAADFGGPVATAEPSDVPPQYLSDEDAWPSIKPDGNPWIGYLGEFFVDRALRAAFPEDTVHWVSGVGRQGRPMSGEAEALIDFVVDDVQGSLTGHPGCVALIEVASTQDNDNWGFILLKSTEVMLAMELRRRVQYEPLSVPIMTVKLVKRLQLTRATCEKMMGKPVIYMVIRVARLSLKVQEDPAKKKPSTTAESNAEAGGSSSAKRLPISHNGAKSKARIAFVLHDPAEMRSVGKIWWQRQFGNMWSVQRTSADKDLHRSAHRFAGREVVADSFDGGAARDAGEEDNVGSNGVEEKMKDLGI